MKMIIFCLLFSFTFSGTVLAQISDHQRHRDWNSTLLNSESGRAVGRAITFADPQTMALVLDFAGNCTKPALALLGISAGNTQSRNITGTVQITIDEHPPRSLPASCTFLGEVATIYIGLEYDNAIITELKRGGKIEASFQALGQPTVQATFSLWGIDAAYTAAQNLCLTQPAPVRPASNSEVNPNLDDDASYFPDSPAN